MVANQLRHLYTGFALALAASAAMADIGYLWTDGNLSNPAGGLISSSDNVAVLGTGSLGSLGYLNNSGTISSTHGGGSAAIWIQAGLTVPAINNLSTGVIESASYDAIVNENSQITLLQNSGQILAPAGGMIAISNGTSGIFSTITNTGTINGQLVGIKNSNVIYTLNNAQGTGNTAGALTYEGNLPNNYNVIVNNPTNYGQLSASSPVTGVTNFGIYNSSKLQSGTYSAVISGVGSTHLGTNSGNHGVYRWQLIEDSTDSWDLVVDSSRGVTNTLTTVQQNASALAGMYNVQAAALQSGLIYDCNTFDQHGLCASLGGRASYGLSTPSANQQAGLLIISHRPDSYFRYGGFVDQSVATASPSGIKYNNSSPMFGFFGYWNNHKDGLGLGASLSTAFSNSSLTTTRSNTLLNTEAGSGNTDMQGQAIQAQGTYTLQANTRIQAIPYLGLRYYRVATGGYSENTSEAVASPLSYNAMAQEVFAAVGGVGTSLFLMEKLTGKASVGIQQNLNYKMGNYQGTSTISGLESFSVNMPSNSNTMATATAGLSFAIKKNEILGFNLIWQQQAFMATNTLTGLATYSFGF